MTATTQEIQIRGIPICRGIAIGKSFFFDHGQEEVAEFSITEADIEGEVAHYRKAVTRSKQDVVFLKQQLESDGAHEGAAILDTHLQIMQDPLLTQHIEEQILKQKKNAEYVFYTHIEEYKRKFSLITDPFFRERFKDLQAISRRILGYLREGKRISLSDIPQNSIVFAMELAASDSAEAKVGSVSAFVTQSGGATSHAAIVAKSKGIPYVANVDFSSFKQQGEKVVIVDGRTGDVVVDPSEETLLKYQRLQQKLADHFLRLAKDGNLAAETVDGYNLRLSANIDMLNEMDMIHQFGCCGVGLFRSEYIFLVKERLPTEEEQFSIYRTLVEKMKGLPIVMRTFDISVDKFNPGRKLQEGNSVLATRAVRFLLQERLIFKTQLRAILRTCIYGDVSIMFPMISGLPELLEAKKIVKEAYHELQQEGVPLKKIPRLGCMIEVPSAAIVTDLLVKECDFVSIGTNDLVQYSLAVDRENQAINWLYNPADPSVLRLIKMIVCEANRHGIPVTVCGEVAADPRFTPLLLGLGINELSVSPRYIPVVKNAIRNTYFLGASHLVEKALTMTTAQEIQDLIAQEYQRTVPDDFFYNC